MTHPQTLIEQIARTAHEVNRAYCLATGDSTPPPWNDALEDQRRSALNGVRFALANPDATPETQHEAWLAEKIAAGWTYGPAKDPVARTHPCLGPYSTLPAAQQVKDYLFLAVVRSMV